ncbi:MAG: hypothetical protein KAS67_07930 [Thermoplasmata archaeon]|nr:hypothetical protein [Thermoplasmata archaeon]
MAQKCPKCGKEMQYYEQVKDWFCGWCQYYLRQLQQPISPVDAVSKRSILNIMKFIVATFCLVSVLLILFGLFQLNVGIGENYDSDWAIRGLMNIIISFGLLIVSYMYISSTVRKKQWWTRMQNFVDIQSELDVGSISMKKSLLEIYQVFYGSVIIIGIIFLSLGIFFLNVFEDSSYFYISGIDILVGIVLVFISYSAYRSEMEKLSMEVYPIIFPNLEKKI